MVKLNKFHQMSAVLACICLVFSLVVGCGGKADSPDKRKEKQETVRKIPVAESQAEVTKSAKPATKALSGETAVVSESAGVAVSKPAATSPPAVVSEGGGATPSVLPAEGETLLPGHQPPTASAPDSSALSPEAKQAKQQEIESITRDAAAEGDVAGQSPSAAISPEGVADSALPPAEMSGTAEETVAPVIDLNLKEDPTAEGEAGEEEIVSEFYNPFEPLFQKKTGISVADIPDPRQQRKFLTPLEKIDIGQLTLTGLIQAESGSRAILVDASGKGYVVKEGTYVGLNSGTVEKIESDRIVIVETKGVRQSKIVLKLQKPAGE